MAIALEAVDPAPPIASRQMRNAIVASVLGWSLDLFDLFILLYVAPVVGVRHIRRRRGCIDPHHWYRICPT
jgi:hypothetical protein